MPRGLILSIGTGSGVENAIAKSIRQSNPEHVVFIASIQSIPTLEKVWVALGKRLEGYETLTVKDEGDVEECYLAAIDSIKSLQKKGLSSSEIALDFTSGTKAMSAGAVLGGSALELSSFVYVGGRRDENGRVITGTERLLSLDPLEPWIDRRVKLIATLFNVYQFRSCLKLFDEIGERVRGAEGVKELDAGRKLVEAYDAWDKFEHRAAQNRFQEITSLSLIRRWTIDWGKNREYLFGLLRDKDAWEKEKDLRQRFSKFLLFDLLLNADRRAAEGKFDDAVGRLYRLTEMLAQAQLARHEIDSSNVDLNKVPENLRSDLEVLRTSRTSKIELPLFKSYELLSQMGEKLGDAFVSDRHLQNYLTTRNNSILAHGTEPVKEKDYRELRNACVKLMLLERPEYEWQKLTNGGKFASLEMTP